MNEQKYEVAVIGGGPAGLLAAILIAGSGLRTICLAPPAPFEDQRTSALMQGSLDILGCAGVLESLEPKSAPLEKIRIIDDTGHLFRGPAIEFDSAEIGQSPFARNFINVDLLDAFNAQANALEKLELVEDFASEIIMSDNGIEIKTATAKAVLAQFVVGADGHKSLSRQAAGIPVKTSNLPQMALAFNVLHSRPHENVSTEFHRAAGPLTLVPLPGNQASVVWVETPEEAERIDNLADAEFADLLTECSYGILGEITKIGPRGRFPLMNAEAHSAGAGRIALVGEAAHVIPPIGAQGLNLGIRDAATIAKLLVEPKADYAKLGDLYAKERARDLKTRTVMVDMLNRSLISDFLPLQALRAAGLSALAQIGPLRRAAMDAGIGPGA